MTESQVLESLKKFVKSHKSLREAARVLSISPGYLSDVLSGRRALTDSVLSAIQVQRVVTYKRKKPEVLSA